MEGDAYRAASSSSRSRPSGSSAPPTEERSSAGPRWSPSSATPPPVEVVYDGWGSARVVLGELGAPRLVGPTLAHRPGPRPLASWNGLMPPGSHALDRSGRDRSVRLRRTLNRAQASSTGRSARSNQSSCRKSMLSAPVSTSCRTRRPGSSRRRPGWPCPRRPRGGPCRTRTARRRCAGSRSRTATPPWRAARRPACRRWPGR